ncbi:hypothetical protein HYH02_010742 [Chlamydomonas schloesseri]|uniref:Uncharacterized protein n=1 Tax=Chlamydomonas schloesseri TaxID=2026947 RepID=A0A835TEL0_9CHLO|nr:hypothetical protein HYH02_010742 [Chlamydomonas schloesseri]|eukprot:KAG2438949.1 hypothetical protein HYH02_010742 [Chlamydomonas schloesseri]
MANPAPELGLEAYLQAMGVAHERQAQDVAALQSSVDEVARVTELLGRLPDKVRHKAMVPFGKHAFLEGELVHTNEFLVGLGCELQLEASAKQAAELLARRQGRAEAALARARLQLRELEARMQDVRMSLTNESGEEFMEIRQDWDEAEQLLRDAAASAAAAAPASAQAGKGAPGRGSSSGDVASSSGKGAGAAAGAGNEEADAEEARIFARLAELERLEAEAGSGGEEEEGEEEAAKGKTEEAGNKAAEKGGGGKGAVASSGGAAPGQSMEGGATGGAGPTKPGPLVAAEPPMAATASSAISASSPPTASTCGGAGPAGPAKVPGAATAAGKAAAASSSSSSSAAAAAGGSGGSAPLRKGFLLGGGGAKAKAVSAAAPAASAVSGVASSLSATGTAAAKQRAAAAVATAPSLPEVSCAQSASSAAQDMGAGNGSGGSGSTSPSASEARRRRRVSFADGSAPGEDGGGDAEMLAAGPFARRSGSPSDSAVTPSSGATTVGLRPALKQGTAPVPAASHPQPQQQQQRQQQQSSAEEFWGPVAARGHGGGPGASGAAPVALFEESACDAAMAMARAREQAFSGQIVERDGGRVSAASSAADGREVLEAMTAVAPAPRRGGVDFGVPPEEPEPPKRMSKFKQQRAGLA